ncbi:MAG: type II secretion system F family protein [Anaerolineae bacterium]|nr:type II secretion system F family protein [Anaerolineae bacterium]
MAYRYIAYTPQGQKIQGRIEADSEEAAEELLWKQNYTVVSLREVRDKETFTLFRGKIKTRELIVFSRQLATLIESGIPIVRALQLLQDQVSGKRLREVLGEIIIEVQQGRFFSEAILRHEKDFPAFYGRLLEVGEQSGNLEMVLRQLALYLEKEEALVRKIRGAVAYPLFVLVMAIGVVFLMLTVALPPLMNLFISFDAELPLPTRILLALTNFFSSYKFYILGVATLLIGAFILFIKTERGKELFDRFLLKIPLIGNVIIQGAVARMCRSMATLLQAGISLPEILEMVIRSQGNRVIRKALEDVHIQLLQGNGLAEPLSEHKVFPGMLIQMVRVGEETGALDTNMQTLAQFYEDEVDRVVGALSSALEPALTIFVGVIVGFVAVSVIMPMYSLMGSIK